MDAPSSQPSPSAGWLPHTRHSMDTLGNKANISCKDTLLSLFLGLVTITHGKMLQVSCVTGSYQQEKDRQVHLNLFCDREPGQLGKTIFFSLPLKIFSSLRDISVQCNEMQHFLFSLKIFPSPWTSVHAGDCCGTLV